MDETPILQVNRTLLAAYNYMWSASTELEIGEPGKAIPWMQKALDALQSARAAERIYLRGKVRTVIVDIDRVRMQTQLEEAMNLHADHCMILDLGPNEPAARHAATVLGPSLPPGDNGVVVV